MIKQCKVHKSRMRSVISKTWKILFTREDKVSIKKKLKNKNKIMKKGRIRTKE